jgi:osmotically-inducible protein OsmY
MADQSPVLDRVRSAIRSVPRLGAIHQDIALAFADGDLTIEGEVASVAAKKLVLEAAAADPAVVGIVDRLRVRPAQPMGDREILDHLRDALLGEVALTDCAVLVQDKGAATPARSPEPAAGRITIAVADGVVTLNGEVPSLARKRLAGALAWWIPGSRDVINGIGVAPPEEDSDEAIADALEIVLEKDPFVDASQVRIGVRRAVVTLTGQVPTESERDMAEKDAWYVFGVDDVVNEIEVSP